MDPRLLLIVGGIAGAASLQGTLGESNAQRRANDFRYTPDPRVMRFLAGSDRSTVADVLWLGALPDMARPFSDRKLKERWLAGATDVITDLEPRFGRVYAWGSAHLALVDKKADAAIALLQKGVDRNPRDAGLRIALAMAYYELKRDKAKTIEHLEAAADLPGVDEMSLAMLASLKANEREDFVALAVFARMLESAANARQRTAYEYELWRTKRIIADRALREFRAKHGRAPATPDELRGGDLIDPKAIDVVLEGLVIDPQGLARYERLVELDRAIALYQAPDMVAAFVEGEGRLPTEEEFLRAFGRLPEPPPGQRWRYAEGKLELVAE